MTTTPRRAISAATTTAELACHIRERDELERDASRELYERIKKPIWRRLIFLVADGELALELLQEAYTRYWAHAPALDPSINVEAWINRVATNLAIDYHRGPGKRARCTTSLSDTPEASEKGTCNEVQFVEQALAITNMEDRGCLRIDLQNALYQLGDLDRKLVILHEMSGYTQRELAHMFDMKEDAIQKRVRRAEVWLREYLRSKGWQPNTMKKEGGAAL